MASCVPLEEHPPELMLGCRWSGVGDMSRAPHTADLGQMSAVSSPGARY